MIAVTATPTALAATPRLDGPFLAAALLALVVLVGLVLADGQPASAGLLLSGFALGAVFLKAELSFTAAFRRFMAHGHADGLIAALLLIAVAATVIVPVAALAPSYGGAIAPLGPSLIIGAFVFGIGMQLANGCGSGTLYAVGGGSGRMLVTLAFFVLGSLIGSPTVGGILEINSLLGLDRYPVMFVIVAGLLSVVGVTYAFVSRNEPKPSETGTLIRRRRRRVPLPANAG